MASLVNFGFTALESDIYAFLVKEHPSTGYRVSQGIGKAAANTYKALETLERKGAIFAEGGSSKGYRPVAPEALFTRLEKEFDRNKIAALKVLKSLGKVSGGEGTKPISSREAGIFEAQTLISEAKDTIVLVASHDTLSQLELGRIKTTLWVMTNGKCDLEDGAVLISLPEEAFDHPTLQVVTDHQNALFLVEETGFSIHQHPLAAALHQSVVCQMGLYLVDRKLEEDASRKQISKVIEGLP
jgi:hypothetical protein